MKADQREFTFLVRLRRHEEPTGVQWRGSVHEVISGNRRFVSGTRDIIDFISAYLRGEGRTER